MATCAVYRAQSVCVCGIGCVNVFNSPAHLTAQAGNQSLDIHMGDTSDRLMELGQEATRFFNPVCVCVCVCVKANCIVFVYSLYEPNAPGLL